MAFLRLGPKRVPQAIVVAPFRDDRRGRRPLRRAIGFATLAVFCLIYGLIYGFVTPYLIVPLLVPVGVLGLIVIWALPDLDRAPTKALGGLFFATLVLGAVWPNYLCIALPGLPWITVVRITSFPMAVILLICVSASPEFRDRTAQVLKATPILLWLVVAFTVLEVVSVGFSTDVGDSLQKLVVALVGWTAMFFASAYLFSCEGRMKAWAATMWAMAIGLGVLCCDEYHARHILWAGHIPHFLQVSDELMKRYLAGFGRNYTNEYRTKGTFTTPLGMGEFFALAMPFVIQFVLGEYRTRTRILAGLSAAFLFIPILFTGSRTGMIGYFMAIMLYLPIWGLQRWRRGDLLGPAVVLGYPAIGAVFLAATFVIGHLRRIVWGGGETASSNQGRYDQYHMAVPKVLHHPWGYGIGRGGITLNY
ncbi:MAG: O-antigen ligase family protein, partial [Caulobacteraceae bacterium]